MVSSVEERKFYWRSIWKSVKKNMQQRSQEDENGLKHERIITDELILV